MAIGYEAEHAARRSAQRIHLEDVVRNVNNNDEDEEVLGIVLDIHDLFDESTDGEFEEDDDDENMSDMFGNTGEDSDDEDTDDADEGDSEWEEERESSYDVEMEDHTPNELNDADYDDYDEERSVMEGEVRVLWLGSNRSSIESEEALEVVDRKHMRGDLVTKASDPLGQCGVVTEIDVLADVRVLDSGVSQRDIYREKSVRAFTPTRKFQPGHYVVKDSWVGQVEDVSDDVVVSFDNGANICTFMNASVHTLRPVHKTHLLMDDADYCRFHPGQVVQPTSKLFKRAKFSKGSLSKITKRNQRYSGVVKEVLPGKLEIRWIATRCTEGTAAAEPPPCRMSPKKLIKLDGVQMENFEIGDIALVSPSTLGIKSSATFMSCEIVRTKSFCTVQWQDGTITKMILGKDLLLKRQLEEYEFYPDQYIMEKLEPVEVTSGQRRERSGIIKSVNATERMAVVAWAETDANGNCVRLGPDESVPVFQIREHPYLVYALGDVVMKLPNEKASTEQWVGEVLNLQGGGVKVRWQDKSVSVEAPHGLYIVDNETMQSAQYDNGFHQPSFNSVMDDLDAGSPDTQIPDDAEEENSEEQTTQPKNSTTASYIYEAAQRGRPAGLKSIDEDADANLMSLRLGSNHQPTADGAPVVMDQKESDQNQFDSFPDSEGHHFHNQNQGTFPRKWSKVIMEREWPILAKSLPPALTVRCFDDRVDLLSALIEGTSDTPYEDGLFCFDLQFPTSYPAAPPLVHYRSYGYRINPNLYENGRVCLSILNTWTGGVTERWNPQTSSVLQVLVSIQGLVLISDPYYNEAGYEAQRNTEEGEKNAKEYNEGAYLDTCKTMMCLINSPPKPFAKKIINHFLARRENILRKCQERLADERYSMGFKLALKKLLPQLESTLATL